MKSLDTDVLTKKPYFTSTAVAQLYGLSERSAAMQLSRWVTRGVVIRLKQGYYTTQHFYLSHGAEQGFLEAISTIIDPFSYLSKEYILQKHAVLTEATYLVTAITEKNTHHVENKIGNFDYKHIKSALYTGFEVVNYFGIPCKLASKAKALFDYFYYRPLHTLHRTTNLAEELRLNIDEWQHADRQEFAYYIKLSTSPKMQLILKNLERHVW